MGAQGPPRNEGAQVSADAPITLSAPAQPRTPCCATYTAMRQNASMAVTGFASAPLLTSRPAASKPRQLLEPTPHAGGAPEPKLSPLDDPETGRDLDEDVYRNVLEEERDADRSAGAEPELTIVSSPVEVASASAVEERNLGTYPKIEVDERALERREVVVPQEAAVGVEVPVVEGVEAQRAVERESIVEVDLEGDSSRIVEDEAETEAPVFRLRVCLAGESDADHSGK